MGPVQGSSGHRKPFVQGHQIVKSQQHDPLGEETGIPIRKPDFSLIKENAALICAQDQSESRPNSVMNTEFLLYHGACRKVDLVRVLGRPLELSFVMNVKLILCMGNACKNGENDDCQLHGISHGLLMVDPSSLR